MIQSSMKKLSGVMKKIYILSGMVVTQQYTVDEIQLCN